MDPKSLYNLSYGVFVLGASDGKKVNACITNTCIQITSDPLQIAISVLNKNYTCDMIKKNQNFCISVLDKSCTFDTIKRFGFASGRDTDKFEDIPYFTDKNGNPYPCSQICSVFSCEVVSSQNLGTHTLFIASITDAKITSNKKPITYADYQSDIKSKPQINNDKKIIGWRCKICGYVYEGETLPSDFICPTCGHPSDDFEPIYES